MFGIFNNFAVKGLVRVVPSFLYQAKFFSKFADPTYDSTFKMLFANPQHHEILKSLINNLLGFKGPQQVREVELLTQEFPPEFSYQITTLLDVRCKTDAGEEILVEMQRHAKNYFLARTQFHMAKAISSHIKEGEGKLFHTVIPKTYVLAIAREGLFTRKYTLDNDDLYEITVVPTIKELGQEVPENKMHWKFYELNKFIRLFKEGKISADEASKLSIKDQWLYFLHECSNQEAIPENVDKIIQHAYKIMEQANWPREIKLALERSQLKEIEELEELDSKKAEGRTEGRIEGRVEGRVEGKTEATLSIVKNMFAKGLDAATIAEYTRLSITEVEKLKTTSIEEIIGPVPVSENLVPIEYSGNCDTHLNHTKDGGDLS